MNEIEKQAKINEVAQELTEITTATVKASLEHRMPDTIEVDLTITKIDAVRKRPTGKKRRVVKVKRGPGKGRVRKSWLRAYSVKFNFREDNGSPIVDLFRTWVPTVIYPAEYTEKTL